MLNATQLVATDNCVLNDHFIYSASLLSRNALPITVTELKLMAAAAIMGLSKIPNIGYSIPAAKGTPKVL